MLSILQNMLKNYYNFRSIFNYIFDNERCVFLNLYFAMNANDIDTAINYIKI